jgi:hypothetical protein
VASEAQPPGQFQIKPSRPAMAGRTSPDIALIIFDPGGFEHLKILFFTSLMLMVFFTKLAHDLSDFALWLNRR